MIKKINVSECVKIWYIQQKIRKIFWVGSTASYPDSSIVGRGCPLPTPHPLDACGTPRPLPF